MRHLIGACFLIVSVIDGVRAQYWGGTGGKDSKPSCIDGNDQARTPDGWKSIESLRVGDLVAVGLIDRRMIFEPLMPHLHFDPTRDAVGRRFRTSSGKTLTLSNEHLVFVGPSNRSVLAKSVRVGDSFYFVDHQSTDSIGHRYVEETVIEATAAIFRGRYSPLTPSGTILVNDLLVSCYSNIEDHDLMHRMVGWLWSYFRSEQLFSAGKSLGGSSGLHIVGEILWNMRDYVIHNSGF